MMAHTLDSNLKKFGDQLEKNNYDRTFTQLNAR